MKIEDLTEIFKCLADSKRLRILMALTQTEELTGKEIREALPDVAPPNVTHHLVVLREADLIWSFQDGSSVSNRLTDLGKQVVSHVIPFLEDSEPESLPVPAPVPMEVDDETEYD